MCEFGGCNDTDATNFNAAATYNDGSCTYHKIGCMVRATPRGATHGRFAHARDDAANTPHTDGAPDQPTPGCMHN